MTLQRSRILGLGGYVPDRVVTNEDLTQWMDTTNEWIIERTGIEERRWVPTDGSISGAKMGAWACEAALKDAGVDKNDVDMIIYATLSPDHDFPGTGVFMQRELGLDNPIPCLDIRQQCSGFIYGLSIADQFIKTGMYKKILVVGSEIHSTGLDKTTRGRDVAVLFGDGAGAALVGVSDDPEMGIMSSHIHAEGKEAEILWIQKPGCRYNPRITAEDLEEGLHYPKMQGRKVFKNAVTRMPQAIMEGMVANDLKLDDIDMLIPHQANLRINQMVAKMIGLPPEKMHNNIQKLGNTTAATIPLCLLDAIKEGKVKRGDLLCMVAFGAGLTWGSVFLRY
jgi:3-oxoacyl-[acyl-carrier-protein] synthase-3